MRKIPFCQLTLLILVILGGVLACSASSYRNPPQDLRETDLVGVWEVRYGKHTSDRLSIREDGKYRQEYVNAKSNYVFETDWKSWRIQKFTDGRVYIHFDGGRYYPAGVRIAESNGWGDPCPEDLPDCYFGNNPRWFYDPYAEEDVEMVHELVLTIRADTHGEIVFHHMWTSSDRGFAIIGGQSEIFRRVDDLIPMESQSK